MFFVLWTNFLILYVINLTIWLLSINVPVDLFIEFQLSEPAAAYLAQLLSHVLDLVNRVGQLLICPKLRRFQWRGFLALVNNAFDAVTNASIFPLKVTFVPCRVKTDERSEPVLQVLK